jgi:hypothetical protein
MHLFIFFHYILGVNCSAAIYSCDLGATCVSKALQCNGNRDCRDGSDELGCLTSKCYVVIFTLAILSTIFLLALCD